MAITQTYCDFATGNDYKGASFVDGAFTHATLTLTKAGAFAASKVNHWLYLTDNGSATITPGYYKVATVPDANSVTLATDPSTDNDDVADVKCTQHDGTTTLPWRSVQGALDLITRDATNGDQVNVKAGTTQVLAAALTLTTYGTPASTAALVIRGYTAAADDEGRGVIQGAGVASFYMFAASTYDYISLVDLDISNFKTPAPNEGVVWLDDYCQVIHCSVAAVKGGAGSAVCIKLGDYSTVAFCDLTATYRGGCIALDLGGSALGNYCHGSGLWGGIRAGNGSAVIGNIVCPTYSAAWSDAIRLSSGGVATQNIIYGIGIVRSCRGMFLSYAANAYNNLICNLAGENSLGILCEPSTTSPFGVVGANAFWNLTANESLPEFAYLTPPNVLLAADPFTDAANGDFSLTAAAKAALADKGFPTQYLGAHANTVSHMNIGPIQMAEADYPAEGDVESGVTYGSGAYTGDFDVPAVADVQSGVAYGDDGEFTGTFAVPAVGKVIDDTSYGGGGVEYTGTYHATGVAEVLDSVNFGAASGETGTYHAPDTGEVIDTAVYGPASGTAGTFAIPAEADVESGVGYGDAGVEFTGTFTAPAVGDVQATVQYGGGGTEYTGTFTEPGVGNVESGVGYGGGGVEFTGTFGVPAVADVQSPVQYGAAGTEFTGTFTAPAVADVQSGVQFGGGGTEYTGTFGVPSINDVQETVQYGGAGTEYTGVFGVPAEAQVESGVGFGANGTEFTGSLVGGGGGPVVGSRIIRGLGAV